MALVLLAVAVVAAVTLVLYPISEIDPGVSSGVLYVLGVLVVTTTRGLRMGLFSAALSLFALDYFHTDPTGDLISGKSAGDLVAIFTVTLTAVVGAVIADTARRRAVESEERRVRLDEVRESRARVLAAADRERQRVVRDIHDGAQQRLVHTVVNLKLAVRQLDRDDPEAARPLVAEALQNAQAGTDELRELAHGIMPSVLTRGGLRAAVQTLTSRMPMPVVEDVTDERFPAEVESTAYFAVAEALTNVAKHAQAEEAYVTIAPADGVLRVEIRDDGVGGAFAGGSGLLGLEDRLAAAHGTLKVVSPPGDGTTISIELPVDAPTS
ncbi:signal transduction histidine kinase [Solirubrobacter pauli]|uniref:histidine kinase n=1 Tax=Solirubrobacter pauli TaxID=166793 RepID=A0A660LGX2_9ACTN|nr:signal transduction histidine kinase [Solirubrobacter pauli]